MPLLTPQATNVRMSILTHAIALAKARITHDAAISSPAERVTTAQALETADQDFDRVMRGWIDNQQLPGVVEEILADAAGAANEAVDAAAAVARREQQEAPPAPGASAPEQFRVRLRFRVATPIHISTHEHGFVAGGRDVVLRAEQRDDLIENSNWLIMTAGGFSSESEGQVFAQKLKAAAQLASVMTHLGIDAGLDKVTAWAAPELRALLGAAEGVIVRNNVHGIDVYPDAPTKHVTINAKHTLRRLPGPFFSEVDAVLSNADTLSDRTKTAVLLLNLALLNRQEYVTQIIFAVSAVEMLGQDENWTMAQQELLRALADEAVAQTALGTETEREEVSGAIRKSVQRLGLRQGVLRVLSRLGRPELRREWDDMYGERSGLVHGLAHVPGKDYSGLAAKTLSLCGRIILYVVAREIPGADRHAEEFFARPQPQQ